MNGGDLREAVRHFAKELIVREMKARGLTYRELAAMVAPYNIATSEDVLYTKIRRGTFSARVLIICLREMGVSEIDLAALDLSVEARNARHEQDERRKKDRRYREEERKQAAQRKQDRKAARDRKRKWKSDQKRARMRAKRGD